MLIRIFTSPDSADPSDHVGSPSPLVKIRINVDGEQGFQGRVSERSKLCRNSKRSDNTRNTKFTNRQGLMEGNGHYDGENAHQSHGGHQEEESRVGKIRDLLFGEQMVGYEERFAQLEQNLNTKVDELRRDVEKLLADLRVELSEKSESIERDGVKRDRLATKLEALAASLRDRSE